MAFDGVDWLDLQRLATALVMPLPLGLALGLIGLALVWRLRWLGVVVAGMGVSLIGACSLPVVATALMSGLKVEYPPQTAADCEPADAIVLLGGAVQPLLMDDVRPRLHRGSDRVWQAARLYHAGCAPLIVVSAGGKLEPPVVASEAEAIAELLIALGVPQSALRLEAQSRNTQGNAAFSRDVLGRAEGRRVLLVTSAWHLRRAVALFEHQGFEVLPAGADYRSLRSCRGLHCWLPSAGALEASALAVKEHLGYWVQVRLRA
ncbi:YdcF family protein [uncultured Thiohalocapsa sp.]|uniref:YdcF family protein n=1 Tax=uncultured Thiohalocapsa sp. TaxID=768990 RepID=UPI0025F2B0F2|nr:YdcF family protein [uncultured Thiohalocapsa sp.]